MQLADEFARCWNRLLDTNEEYLKKLLGLNGLRSSLEIDGKLDWLKDVSRGLQVLLGGGQDEVVLLDRLAKDLENLSGHLREFATLTVIDTLYPGLATTLPGRNRLVHESPKAAAVDMFNRLARRRLEEAGRLNDPNSPVAVIPKRGRLKLDFPVEEMPRGCQDKWQMLAGAMNHLVVLPETVPGTKPDDRTRKRPVSVSYMSLDSWQCAPLPPGESLKIAVAPLAQDSNDLRLTAALDAATGNWAYDVKAGSLGTHLRNAVEQAVSGEVHLLLLPELCMSETLDKDLKRALTDLGPGRLRLIIAGTRPERGADGRFRNRAVVYSAAGQRLLDQDKLTRWNIRPKMARVYGIDGYTGPTLDGSPTIQEGTEAGDCLLVFDSMAFGRLAILICEDLTRPQPAKWLVTHINLDGVLCPIMDQSFRGNASNYTWPMDSMEILTGAGCGWAVAATSLTLTCNMNAHNSKPGGTPDYILAHCCYGLFKEYRPPEDGRTHLAGDRQQAAEVRLDDVSGALCHVFQASDWTAN